MASPLGLTPLSREEVEGLASQVAASRTTSLPGLWLPFHVEGEEVDTIGVCYLIYVRAGGFMIILPRAEVFQEQMSIVDQAGTEAVAYKEVRVNGATFRGRVLRQVDALLADLPWSGVGSFFQAQVIRTAVLKNLNYVQFEVDGVPCRVSAASALEAADEWIQHGMDSEVAQDYYTGTEVEPELIEVKPGAAEGDPVDPEVVTRLLERVAELEGALKQKSPTPLGAKTAPKASAAAPAPEATQGLFAGKAAGGELQEADWARLEKLAGPPPGKQSAVLRGTALKPLTEQQGSLFAEVEKEVADPTSTDALLGALQQSSNDPVQQLMVVQLQQNAALLQALVKTNKMADPLVGALSGGGDSGSGSSSGVKGCIARDLYIKSSQDLVKLGEIVRANALQELGMSASREDGQVMKRYVERRIPLQEHRLLSHFAVLIAEGWDIAYQSGNAEMIGFLAKMAMFTEQTALDGGKLQLSWLLTGFTEPNRAMMFGRNATPGLKPFSRLASAAWITANLAYLKDLDYAESRLSTLGKKGDRTKAGGGEETEDKKGKKGDKAKAKGKGRPPALEEGAAST